MTDLKKIKKDKTIAELLEFGIINIDKSSGPTSFNISDFVKKKLNLRKTSHFGTLDPKVTGVLPIALNRACKLTGFFLGEDKEYIGIMRMHEEISLEKIKEKIKEKFLGKIIQMPPVKSRVKRVEREREIISFEILEKDGKDFLFKTEVQGGTYIRKLIDDLGKELDVGAHMLELRRIRAGIFGEHGIFFASKKHSAGIFTEDGIFFASKKHKEDSPQAYPDKSSEKISTGGTIVNLYDFEKAVDEYEKGNEELLRKIIFPAEEALKKIFPVIQVKEEFVKKLLTGKPLLEEDIGKIEYEKFAVFYNERFIGIYKKFGKIAKAEFVMQEMK